MDQRLYFAALVATFVWGLWQACRSPKRPPARPFDVDSARGMRAHDWDSD
jgi:hypothetical protein